MLLNDAFKPLLVFTADRTSLQIQVLTPKLYSAIHDLLRLKA